MNNRLEKYKNMKPHHKGLELEDLLVKRKQEQLDEALAYYLLDNYKADMKLKDRVVDIKNDFEEGLKHLNLYTMETLGTPAEFLAANRYFREV